MWKWLRRKAQSKESEANAFISSDGEEEATSEACPKCAKFSPTLDDKLFEYKERIHGHIHSAKKGTDEEVLAIGECVNSIVSHTCGYLVKEQVDHLLEIQKKTRPLISEILVEMKKIERDTLDEMLKQYHKVIRDAAA